MPMSIYECLWFFMIYALLGWILEVMYHAVHMGIITNRGFLAGPVCPVYGFGILSVLLIISPFAVPSAESIPLYLLFPLGVVLATGIELFAGWILDVLFHTRWWDYRDLPMNFKGYICLEFSLLWGLAVVFVIRLLHPMIANQIVARIPPKIGWPVLLFLYIVFFIDLIVTVSIIIGLNRKLKELDQIQSSMRQISDGMSAHLGKNTLDAAQRIQHGQVQISLAKTELKNAVSDTRAEFKGAVQETREQLSQSYAEKKHQLEVRRDQLIQTIMAPSIFGFRRLTNAFPNLMHRDYGELVDQLKARMKKHR